MAPLSAASDVVCGRGHCFVFFPERDGVKRKRIIFCFVKSSCLQISRWYKVKDGFRNNLNFDVSDWKFKMGGNISQSIYINMGSAFGSTLDGDLLEIFSDLHMFVFFKLQCQ